MSNLSNDKNQSSSYYKYLYTHLSNTFSNDLFGCWAESFARFFGTPFFLGVQTIIVIIWIVINIVGFVHFDIYPFILLNLAFSLQAAYAAPLILLAQTRQAERDKIMAEADSKHREEISLLNEERQKVTIENTKQIVILLQQNTELTLLTKELAERIEILTQALHHNMIHIPSSEQ